LLIAFWIVAGLTALAFFAAGVMKVTRPKEKLVESGMAWAEDFSQPVVRLIGAAEILGALGIVLPMLTGIAPILSPIAAACLAVLMIGATVVHIRRHEPPISAALLVLAVATAILGFIVVLG
jgi:uncharacterized membrane protein YphA (DoxX/SURF4 family)